MTFTTTQAALLDRARQNGHSLNPERPDDAAVLLRAERLVLDGASGAEALVRACEELLASSSGRRAEPLLQTDSFATLSRRLTITNGPQPELVFCPTCGTRKPYVAQAGFAYPRCGHRPVALAQPGA